MSNQSTNFTRAAQWNRNGKTSYLRWLWDAFSSNMTSCRRSIRSRMMSSSLSRSCTIKLSEFKEVALKMTKMMLVLSWLAFQKMVKALRRTIKLKAQRLVKLSWHCPTFRSKHILVVARASPRKVMEVQMKALCPSTIGAQPLLATLATCLKLLVPRTIERIHRSKIEQETWLVDTERELYQHKISSSVNSLKFSSLQEWTKLKFRWRHRAMCRYWRLITRIR